MGESCRSCGRPIEIRFVTPVKTYAVDPKENIVRVDEVEESPYLEFRCREDPTHEIGNDPQMLKWMEFIATEFREKLIFLREVEDADIGYPQEIEPEH